MTDAEKAVKYDEIAEAWRMEDRDDIEWLKCGYGIVRVIDDIIGVDDERDKSKGTS